MNNNNNNNKLYDDMISIDEAAEDSNRRGGKLSFGESGIPTHDLGKSRHSKYFELV